MNSKKLAFILAMVTIMGVCGESNKVAAQTKNNRKPIKKSLVKPKAQYDTLQVVGVQDYQPSRRLLILCADKNGKMRMFRIEYPVSERDPDKMSILCTGVNDIVVARGDRLVKNYTIKQRCETYRNHTNYQHCKPYMLSR